MGLCGNVQADGLALDNIVACYITLRAWKHDGRCTEISVKAHSLEGRLCVHRRLIVGDGYVTITKGESIRRFFEHAEETEEEEVIAMMCGFIKLILYAFLNLHTNIILTHTVCLFQCIY